MRIIRLVVLVFLIVGSTAAFADEREKQNKLFERRPTARAIENTIAATDSFDFDFLGNLIEAFFDTFVLGLPLDLTDTRAARDRILTKDIVGIVGLGFRDGDLPTPGELSGTSPRAFGREAYLQSIIGMASHIAGATMPPLPPSQLPTLPANHFFKQFRHRVDSVKSYKNGKYTTAELTTFLFTADLTEPDNGNPETWFPTHAWRCVFQYRKIGRTMKIEHIMAAAVPVSTIDSGRPLDEAWFKDGDINPYYAHISSQR